MFLFFPRIQSLTSFHHAITTREGGVSSGEFAALNLAFHVGDDANSVRANRRILSEKLNFDASRLVAMNQVHGSEVAVVKANDAGRGAFDLESAQQNVDALATNEANLPLLVQVADCAPILIVDRQTRAFAVVHAGWRGALAGIAGNAVRTLQTNFGASSSDLLCGIGPCLSVRNLEVGEEVAQLVEKVDAKSVVRRVDWPKPHLDLRGLIQRDLESAGVVSDNVEIRPQCSFADARFFSHRGQNGRAGRFGIVAWNSNI